MPATSMSSFIRLSIGISCVMSYRVCCFAHVGRSVRPKAVPLMTGDALA